jgi:hypothetical protein
MEMIKFRSIAIFILIASAVVLSGCASKGETYKFYSGENRTADKLAKIVPFHEMTMSPMGRTSVYIIEIDGKTTENYRWSIPTYEILPGEHKLKLGFSLIRIGNTVRDVVVPEYMVFTAKSGHTYITKGNFPKTISEGQSVISFWLEDMNTKEVVAGTKPNMNALGEPYKPILPIEVLGTATDPELQSDITQQLFVEASKYYHDCEHNVLKAEAYRSSQRSVIASEAGGKSPELEQRLRDNDQMLVEKWFVKSCDTVGKYEVLLMRADTGTDIMVKKLEPLQ